MESYLTNLDIQNHLIADHTLSTEKIGRILDEIELLNKSALIKDKVLAYNKLQEFLLAEYDDGISGTIQSNIFDSELKEKLATLQSLILNQENQKTLDTHYANDIISSNVLNKKTKDIISLFLAKKNTRLNAQNNLLDEFLSHSIANKNLNEELTILIQQKNISDAEKKIISDLRYISHKTIGLGDFEKIKEKLESSLYKIKQGIPLIYKDQLDAREYGVLSDFVKAGKKLNNYKDFHSITGLLEKIQQVEKMLDLIEDRFIDEQKYKNGDIVMYDIERENIFKNIASFTKEQNAIWYFLKSKYGHAAQINYLKDGSPLLSHVYGQYENKKIDFEQAMFSDVFRFDASKLLTAQAVQKAKEKFGDNWQEKVNEVYQQSQQKIYEEGVDGGFKNLKNSPDKRYESGKAEIFGHSIKEEQDFKELSERFYHRDGAGVDDNIMICSEFVARSTIASLVMSNDLLKDELGMENALDIPFSKNEDLNKVHTQRLIDKLMEKECITQVRKPNIQIMLFKEPEKAHYKTILNMTKVVEEQLKNFDASMVENELPFQRDTKILRITETLIDKFVETYNKNNPFDAIEISQEQKEELKQKLSDSVSELVDKSGNLNNDINTRKGVVAFLCYTILDAVLKFLGKTTYKEEEMAKSLENDFSAIASTVRDTGIKNANSDVVQPKNAAQEILQNHSANNIKDIAEKHDQNTKNHSHVQKIKRRTSDIILR